MLKSTRPTRWTSPPVMTLWTSVFCDAVKLTGATDRCSVIPPRFCSALRPLAGRLSILPVLAHARLVLHRAGLTRATLTFLFSGPAVDRAFVPCTGFLLHRSRLARAMLFFFDGTRPPLGWALQHAAFSRDLIYTRLGLRGALRWATCATRRAFHPLCRGQATARNQGRCRNRGQQAFSHRELSFVDGEPRGGLTQLSKNCS